MNFLAHLYLSGDHPKVMVGNFIGDFVKGKELATRYGPLIVLGIELHRSIDYFTDRHPVVSRSKKRLFPTYRHYSGVIVDVFFDHFLANQWQQYLSMPLTGFAANAYDLMNREAAILPEEVNRMLPHMMRGNWLVSYSLIEGVHRALSGMASRTPYTSKMELASNDLREQYEEFRNDFDEFFPELRKFAEKFLLEHDLKI